MPRLSKEINPFDGGLNNYSDPRDIEDNELATATNVNTSNAGRITIGDDFSVGAEETFLTPFRQKGLFRFNSDYNLSNALGDTEFEMMADDTGEIFRKVSGTTSWTSVLDMNSAGGSGDNSYYVADGGVRVSDTTFATELQYIGISDRTLFGGSNTIDLVAGDAAIEEPDTGKFLFDPATPATEAITDGTINLEIQQKTASQTTVVDFNDASVSKFKTDDIQVKHGYPSYNTDNNFDGWGGSNHYQNSNTYGASGRFSSLQLTSSQGSILVQPQHDGTGTDKFLSIVKKNQADTSEDYFRATIRLNESTMQQDFEDKSFYFKLYVPADVKNLMTTNGLRIRIGNTMKTWDSTDGADYWTFDKPAAELNADDWTEIECAYGSHDDVEGAPVPYAVDSFSIQFKFNSNNLDWTDTNTTTFCLDDIKIGESTRGLWNGYYRWYYSWIYDTKQESKTFQFTNQTSPIIIENKIIQAKVQAIEHSNGFKNDSSYSKRITGANIYYAEFDLDGNPIDSDKKLFMISDFERGVKKPSDESYSSWDTTNDGGGENDAKTQSVYTVYFDTPLIDTFQTTAGYIEDDKISKIQGKTATVMNRRAYIANIKLKEDTGSTKYYTDRIYKSEPNMFDVFTELSYIDVAINDGDTNTALIGFGDFLLQFKSRTMYLINVTQDIEYLEGAYEFRGVWGEAAVCKTPEGIAWVNDYGVFLFNGNEVIDLLGKKIDRKHWQLFMSNADPSIAYRPITQDIVVINKGINGSLYLYNMITESWTLQAGVSTGYGVVFDGIATNMITLNDGTVKMYTNDEDVFTPHIWTTVAQVKSIDVVTKDQTLGDPAQRKTLKKVYITHKGTSTLPQVKYISNNDGVLRLMVNDVTDNDYLPASSTMTTTAFTPVDAAHANNKYSYQVSIAGTAHTSVVINDISLVYRDKTLK